MLPEEKRQSIIMLLQSALQTLGLIPLADLEAHVAECDKSLNYAESFGPLFDPTGYIKASASGEFEDAKDQATITHHMLAALRLIYAREAKVKARIQKKEQQ